MKKYVNYKKHFNMPAAIAIILAALVWFSFPTSEQADGALEITFVDIGQGDSIFIKTPEGETLLIDGGEDEVFDSCLKPFLLSQKIWAADFALATHYHSDHAGGISKLLEVNGVKTLVIPDYQPENKTKTRLLSLAEESNSNVLEVSEGDTLPLNCPDLRISVLHPPKGGFSDNENDNSLVLKLEYFDTTILLTGDLEADGEASLLDAYDLESDILKVGHHGSSTSTSKEFLEAVDPTYAVIQCGKDNSYGHPHYETLTAIENDDVRIYRTDEDGHITFRLSEKGIISIKTSKN